jgi:hypothetical protein
VLKGFSRHHATPEQQASKEESTMKSALRKITVAMGIIFFGTFLSATANAECGNLKLSKTGTLQFQPMSRLDDGLSRPSLLRVQDNNDPIVGMWQVTLVSQGSVGIPDGTVIDKGFQQWHSDGTEILNSSRAPVTQSFCLGVWKQTEPLHYKLNHFAISWDQNSNLIGPANIRERVTLHTNGNVFAGKFTIDQYDQAGNNLAHIMGTVTGTRITPDTPASKVF